MNINNLIIYTMCFLIFGSVAFAGSGDKQNYFYQDAISKLYKIVPDTWEIIIKKSAKPYGYKKTAMKGIYVSFKGRTKAKPLYPKRLSDYESFYFIIMPPEFLMEEIYDHRQAMRPDIFLGEANGYKVFYGVMGTVNGSIPTWSNWKEEIMRTLKINR